VFESDPCEPIIAVLCLVIASLLWGTWFRLLPLIFTSCSSLGIGVSLFRQLSLGLLFEIIILGMSGISSLSLVDNNSGVVSHSDFIDLVHACLFLFLEPVRVIIFLAHFGGLLDLLDEVAHVRHLLLLLVIPLRQAEVLIHHNDVARLLVLEEKGVGEEHFAPGQHLLLRVVFGLGDELVHEHVEGHVFFAFVIVLILDDLLLEADVLLDLGFARWAALAVALVVAVLYIIPLILLPCLAHFLVLVLAAVTAFEKGAAFDIARLAPRFLIPTLGLPKPVADSAHGGSALSRPHPSGLLLQGRWSPPRIDQRGTVVACLILRLHEW